MRGSLSVRVRDGSRDRLITPWVRDLRFRKTAPGGHHSASMRLLLPRNTFKALGPADRLYVYDSRSSSTVWEGYTENPGATDGPDGQSFDLSVIGGMLLALDQAERLIYIETALDAWRRDDTVSQAASAGTDVSAFPDTGNPCLKCQFNPGQPVGTGAQARMIYDAFSSSPMFLGGFTSTSKGGVTNSAYSMQWLSGNTTLGTRTLTASGALMSRFAGTDWAGNLNSLAVRLTRTAGTVVTVPDDDVWAGFGGMRIIGRRVDQFGTLQTHSQTSSVLASEVVADVFGRMLNQCDPTASVIETTSTPIDQLAYPDAARAADVFGDLSLYEPGMLWEILESLPSGKHRFNYRAWATEPRYEISVRDGFIAPGGEIDLCNRVAVNWEDEKGFPQTTIVTSVVPELGTRTRDAESVTLPEGRGSLAAAQWIGAQVLAAKNSPPKAATAVVRRPIKDLLRGLTVMPWEIEPGYVVRVRETGDDLRLTEMEYADADCAATLTLGTPVLTQEQVLARIR